MAACFMVHLLFAKETGTGRAVGHSEERNKDLQTRVVRDNFYIRYIFIHKHSLTDLSNFLSKNFDIFFLYDFLNAKHFQQWKYFKSIKIIIIYY